MIRTFALAATLFAPSSALAYQGFPCIEPDFQTVYFDETKCDISETTRSTGGSIVANGKCDSMEEVRDPSETWLWLMPSPIEDQYWVTNQGNGNPRLLGLCAK